MTPQATDRKEGGLLSCLGRSWKLHTFTQKEVETSLESTWCADFCQGGVPGQWVGMEGIKRGK